MADTELRAILHAAKAVDRLRAAQDAIGDLISDLEHEYFVEPSTALQSVFVNLSEAISLASAARERRNGGRG
jgi:hypothetical protein